MIHTKTRIKKTWNNIGKEYGGYRRLTWAPIVEFLDKVDSDLLDIGAGNCNMTRIILDKNIKMYAVDFSKQMLKHAPKQVTKIVADATNIPLKRKFKYITAIAIMHHLPTENDRLKFLKEIKRLLAKDGRAIITVRYSLRKGAKLLKWADKHERYYHMFSKKELSNLLDKAKLHHKITKITNNYIIKITN
jgi:ubiquinone/menaquinone biosynthesis C-methylase UbiE